MRSSRFPVAVNIVRSGLYVDTVGNIFVLDSISGDVYKCEVNSTTFVLAADGHRYDSIYDPTPISETFAVDEVNKRIYILDQAQARVIKYFNGSLMGITVIDGSSENVFSDQQVKRPRPRLISVDKTGNILVAEENEISIWTPNGKFHKPVFESNGTFNFLPMKIILDRIGNLYIVNGVESEVIRFNRISAKCKNSTY